MDDFFEWITQLAQPDMDWTYAMVTLVFRFFAVFAVLWLIQAAMQIAAFLIRRSEAAPATAGGGGTAPGGSAAGKASAGTTARGTDAGVDDLRAAAIGLALELEAQPEAVQVAHDRGTSAWAAAGRVRALRNPPR